MKKLLIAAIFIFGCATTTPCLVTQPPKQSNYQSCMMLTVGDESEHVMMVCEKKDMQNMFSDMGKTVNWSKHAWEKCGK